MVFESLPRRAQPRCLNLPKGLRRSFAELAVSNIYNTIGSLERRLIMTKLREFGGNVRQAAEALDIERSNLYRKLKAYGIDPAEAATGATASETIE